MFHDVKEVWAAGQQQLQRALDQLRQATDDMRNAQKNAQQGGDPAVEDFLDDLPVEAQ